jgi:lactose/L-arabinose transport system substrate-binding protein
MKLKRLLAGVAVVALGAILAACSGGSKTSSNGGNSKTLTVWCWDETFNTKAMQDAIASYKKANGKQKVKIVTMAQDDIVQKLNTGLSSGNNKGLPNIVLIEDYRIQGYLNSYPDAFSDLSSIVKKDDFSSYKVAAGTKGGKRYGVPFDSGVTGFFYRTDILKKAGYSDADMQNITWDKFVQIAKDVKSKTGTYMMTQDPSDLSLFRIMMQSAGSWYYKPNGKTVNIANNKVLKDGLKVYKELMTNGTVMKVSGWDAGVAAVQKGKVASSPTGSWYSSTIQGAKDQSGKWRIAPIPRLSGDDSVNASSLGGAGWYVLKGSGNVAGAKDFLSKTFASDPKLMNTIAKDIGVVASLKSALKQPNYQAEYPFYSNQKVFNDLLTWAKKVPEVNYGSGTYQIEDVLKDPVSAIVKGANVDSTLKDAQTQAEAAVKNQ